MELEAVNVRRHIRQLRKSLKSLPSDPSVKDIQDLRKRVRRAETIIIAYMPGKQKRSRQLLKTLKSVCKAAGAVRDMDVLAAKARGLGGQSHDNSFTLLLEHLQAARIASTAKLSEQVESDGKDVRRRLKELSDQVAERFKKENSRRTAKTASDRLHGDAANKLMDALGQWPAFNAENLHRFRIKLKKLRIVLQLAEDPNADFAQALEEVKDKIGDWHDWQQMKLIAEKVLDRTEGGWALKKTAAMERSKFNEALGAARTMKTTYLRA
jgi:CHAD domain-containing protein